MSFSDLKIYTLNATAFIISVANIQPVLTVISLSVAIGYTSHKWYLMHKNDKKNRKNEDD